MRFAGCVIVSDNMSWAGVAAGPDTPLMEQWQAFAANQRRTGGSPKLVCIDVQPNGSTQAAEGGDVLNVGGFSDAVFDVVAGWLADGRSFVAEERFRRAVPNYDNRWWMDRAPDR